MDELLGWAKTLSVVGGGFGLAAYGVLKFIQAMITLKTVEATELRNKLIERVDILEAKLDKSITDCEERMKLLREEYEEKVSKLQAENYLLRLKLNQLETAVEEVNERTSGFTVAQLTVKK